MRSILLKGMNAKPISNLNSVNRFNKSNSNKYKTVRPLSYKGKPFTKANLHELLSDSLVDNNECKDDDARIEDIIETDESESILLVN